MKLRRVWSVAVFAVLAVGVGGASAPSTAPASVWWTVTTVAGAQRSVQVSGLGEDGLRVSDGAGDGTVGLVDLVRLYRGAAGVEAREQSSSLMVLLRDGQCLAGEPGGSGGAGGAGGAGGGESLEWRHPELGMFRFKLKELRGVVRAEAGLAGQSHGLLPVQRGEAADLSGRAGVGSGTEDVVTLLNGDSLRGVVTEITPEHVLLSPAGADAVALAWRAVRHLSIADLSGLNGSATRGSDAADGGSAGWRAELTDGSRVQATGATIEGAVVRLRGLMGLEPQAGKGAAIPMGSVRSLERTAGAAWSLSLVNPVEVEHRPFLSVSRHPVWMVGGTGHRDIRVTAYTRLRWAVPAGYTRLRLSLEAESSAGQPAPVVRILAGERTVYEAQSFPPGQAVPVNVLLDDAKHLTIEIDYGDSAGVRSRIRLIDPTLLRK